MKLFRHLPNFILIAGIVLAMTAVSSAVAKLKFDGGEMRQNPDATRSLPEVISKVKTLEVVNTSIEGQEPNARIIIELRNDSEKPIIAIAVEAGDAKNASGVNVNGFKDGDETPIVVLEPHGTTKVEMPLSYAKPGQPIRVGGVMYADGSGEGDDFTLDTIRRQREHYKAKKSEKKGTASQQ